MLNVLCAENSIDPSAVSTLKLVSNFYNLLYLHNLYFTQQRKSKQLKMPRILYPNSQEHPRIKASIQCQHRTQLLDWNSFRCSLQDPTKRATVLYYNVISNSCIYAAMTILPYDSTRLLASQSMYIFVLFFISRQRTTKLNQVVYIFHRFFSTTPVFSLHFRHTALHWYCCISIASELH